MLLPSLTVTVDAHDPARLAQFWAGLLDRAVVGDAVPGDDTQVGLRFERNDRPKAGPNRIHFHVTSTSLAGQQRSVATALRLGGRHIDVGQLPEEEHIVLADPEGNEFCVIEPGNSFLAGCGLLGEVGCDGTRSVGVFWSEALGWPLVWDQDEETAIQSPRGGTKVAWGGPPVAPKVGRNRLRFDVAVADGGLDGEVERLIALGATKLEVGNDGAVLLADPDGNEFSLRRVGPVSYS
jgi:catechol 2,3-dioxygenase-like lactoylglutathione lyase family enzyme